jgi:FkbM family methyltransferase
VDLKPMSSVFKKLRKILCSGKENLENLMAQDPVVDTILNTNHEVLGIDSELDRLRQIPRYFPTITPIFGREFQLIDCASFLFMYQEIIQKQVYRFQPVNPEPLIIDGGANVGISILFFKRHYPNSRIIAFEPDPKIFDTLKRNVEVFGLKGVTLVNQALWSSETVLGFTPDGADGGRVCHLEDHEEACRVKTVRLRQFLTQPIDFVKLDIEGAETEVLQDSADLLHKVMNIFVEYHSFAGKEQTLHVLVDVLHSAGFRMYISSSIGSAQPFLSRSTYLGMDMQLNIFGFRN